jgi:hypothetical protein
LIGERFLRDILVKHPGPIRKIIISLIDSTVKRCSPSRVRAFISPKWFVAVNSIYQQFKRTHHLRARHLLDAENNKRLQALTGGKDDPCRWTQTR